MEFKRLTNDELNDFISRVVVQLEPALTQQVMSVVLELEEYRTKIENGTLISLPCIRKINSPLGTYEAVYINERDLIQECIVSTDEQGWLIVEAYGCPKHSKIAEAKLKELQNE